MKALKPRSIDLYESFYQRQERSAEQKKKTGRIILPLVLLIMMGAATGALRYLQWELETQMQPVQAYLSNSMAAALHVQAVEEQQQLDKLKEMWDNLSAAGHALDSYPMPDKALLQSVFDLAPVGTVFERVEYASGSGLLKVTAACPKVTDPADYTEKLLNTKRFVRVDYYGYESNKKEEAKTGIFSGADDKYKFVVEATLLPPEEGTP